MNALVIKHLELMRRIPNGGDKKVLEIQEDGIMKYAPEIDNLDWKLKNTFIALIIKKKMHHESKISDNQFRK